MKLKAKYKWNREKVQVKPVFFSWHVGLQYKTLTGYSASSIFCNKAKEYDLAKNKYTNNGGITWLNIAVDHL